MALGRCAVLALASALAIGNAADAGRRLRHSDAFNPFEIFAKTTRAPFGCRKPKPGEKVIYMIVHGEPVEENDADLSTNGKEQAEALRTEPRFEFALSKDPEYRAEAIIMAPSRKAMQTALIAFGEELKDATWDIDPDIKGKGVPNDAIPELGTVMLKQYGASSELMDKYNEHYDHAHMGTHADRFTRFVQHMQERPEKNLIVVATEYEAHLAGAELGNGESRIFAVTSNKEDADKHGWGAFRMLSKPQRWKHCHDSSEMESSG